MVAIMCCVCVLVLRRMRRTMCGTHSRTFPYGQFSDAPIYIYIHGGYWQIVDICKEVSAQGVAPLVAAGIKVIVVDYEKCPKVSLEQLVDEMGRAIDFILDYALAIGTR